MTSQVLAFSLVEGGQSVDVPRDPAEWPYQTVTDAMKDGWRVMKFPNWPFSSMSHGTMHSGANSYWRSCGNDPTSGR